MNSTQENVQASVYWFVGASFGGSDDQTQRFLEEGIWEVSNPTAKESTLVKSMASGDRIAIKAAYVRKKDLPFDNRGNTVSVMAIKAIGKITGNEVVTGNSSVSGNVGIGTTTPAAKLDVSGKFQVDTSGNVVKINNVPTSFPASQGASGTYLQNNGSGTLTWATVSTGGGYVQGGHYGYIVQRVKMGASRSLLLPFVSTGRPAAVVRVLQG
jgi:hypothetical protein